MDRRALVLGHGAKGGGRGRWSPQTAEPGTVGLEADRFGHDGRVGRRERGERAVGRQRGPEVAAEGELDSVHGADVAAGHFGGSGGGDWWVCRLRRSGRGWLVG